MNWLTLHSCVLNIETGLQGGGTW